MTRSVALLLAGLLVAAACTVEVAGAAAPSEVPTASPAVSPTVTPGFSPSPSPAGRTRAPSTPNGCPWPAPPSGAAPAAARAVSGRPAFAAWDVPVEDLPRVAALGVRIVVKSIGPGDDVRCYLDAAAEAGLRVVVKLVATGDYAAGRFRPEELAPLVEPIRDHPALFGYLALVEPSVFGIGLTEMRGVYAAYHALDPAHPVIVSMTDLEHFGTPTDPWARGVADLLWVEWYPVTERGYAGSGPAVFRAVRARVAQLTPGTPVWLVVQCHAYRAGGKVAPSPAELRRQVDDGLAYLGARGIVFYPWRVDDYQSDLRRDLALADTVAAIVDGAR